MMINQHEEEKRIKNAVIDLLHFGETLTYDSLSNKSGLSKTIIKKYENLIEAMLLKLKKSNQFNKEE